MCQSFLLPNNGRGLNRAVIECTRLTPFASCRASRRQKRTGRLQKVLHSLAVLADKNRARSMKRHATLPLLPVDIFSIYNLQLAHKFTMTP